ncbi:MAG: S41 family peptidase [Bacteroidales bacterium]|nr:S41 family peptidase [Bacteroidales bacterium]
MTSKRTLIAYFLLSTLFISCIDKGVYKPDDKQAPRLVQKVNNFVYEFMDDVYLWTATMPTNIDRKYEMDSEAYFEKLLYKPEDKWSFITDDYEAVAQGGQGVETTFGYSIHPVAYILADKNVIFILQFVYADTPAAKAGLKRGDIICKIDGVQITESNYQSMWSKLHTASSITLQLGVSGPLGIDPGENVSMVAVKMQLDAIGCEQIFEIEGHKIGYLFYSNFFGGSEEDLDDVFQRFKAEGVQDVVLDLRYNLGGYVYVATHLTSILAPEDVVKSEKIMMTYQWNASYQAYWQRQGQYDQLRELFDKTVPVNMDLSRIYVLTSYNTASASEFVITGLDPYMQVIKIGTTTRGKYTGAILFQAQYHDGKSWVVDQEIKNWGIQPIVQRYANSLGVTNFKDGFKPDYEVTDILRDGVRQLGDPKEPLLAKALELITGVPAPAAPLTKATGEISIGLEPFNDYFKGSVLMKINQMP